MKKIILYATGEHAETIFYSGYLNEYSIVGVCDSSINKQGKYFHGHKIESPIICLNKKYDYIVIGTSAYKSEIENHLVNNYKINKKYILDIKLNKHDAEFAYWKKINSISGGGVTKLFLSRKNGRDS